MKSNPFVEHILYDVFNESDRVTIRPMMGGYILYTHGKVFALIDDEKLYLKGNKSNEEWFLARGSKKFSYTKKGKGGKKVTLMMNYFLVPDDIVEDREAFREWLLMQG